MRRRSLNQIQSAPYEGPYAELENVSVFADGHPLVQGISLSVSPGEMVRLDGPNGSGKSTILRTLKLIEPVGTPDVTGVVKLFGRNMAEATSKERERLKKDRVGIGFQSPEIPRSLAARQQLTLLNDMLGIQVQDESLDPIAKRLKLREKLDRSMSELSGGERQRLNLARIALKQPDLWLIDEPTGEIDTEGKNAVFSAIRGFCDAGAAAVIVSHDNQVAGYVNRTIMLRDGHLESEHTN